MQSTLDLGSGDGRSLAAPEAATDEQRYAARVAGTVLSGFLTGYFLMFNDALHLGSLVLALPLVFGLAPWRVFWPRLGGDLMLRLMAHFLCWMTLRSFWVPAPVFGDIRMEMAGWLFGAAMLGAFALMVWIASLWPAGLSSAGLVAGFSAAFAALVSILLFYFLMSQHLAGERLRNWFVYGGLNAVSTGLTFGFAAQWLVCLRDRLRDRTLRAAALAAILVLYTAVLFTRSRGALMALVLGHGLLLMSRGWRRGWKPCAMLLATTLVFQFGAPALTWLGKSESEARRKSVVELPDSNPAKEYMARKDSGRLNLYRAGLNALRDWPSPIIGIGQWGTDDAWSCGLRWTPEHLHSAWLATYVHGGAIGLGLFLAVFGVGMNRARKLARSGQDEWLILIAYGAFGVLFDGQTFASLASVPKFEGLLLWFPLLAASALWAQGRPIRVRRLWD